MCAYEPTIFAVTCPYQLKRITSITTTCIDPSCTGPGDAQTLPALSAPEDPPKAQQAQQLADSNHTAEAQQAPHQEADTNATLHDALPSDPARKSEGTAVKTELTDEEDGGELDTAELQVW